MSRRRRKAVSNHALLFAVLMLMAASATVTAALVIRRERKRGMNPTAQAAVDGAQVGSVPVKIVQGRLQIDSLDAWRDFESRAIEDALRRGMRTAEDVLAYTMRVALPRYPWPPPPDSLLFDQWRAMVADAVEILRFDPGPEPLGRSGIRLVQ